MATIQETKKVANQIERYRYQHAAGQSYDLVLLCASIEGLLRSLSSEREN